MRMVTDSQLLATVDNPPCWGVRDSSLSVPSEHYKECRIRLGHILGGGGLSARAHGVRPSIEVAMVLF